MLSLYLMKNEYVCVDFIAYFDTPKFVKINIMKLHKI